MIFRFQEHEPLLWDSLTSAVIDGVRHIAAVADRGKPDARLSALIATLMQNAKLPAGREMDHRLAEEQASANRDDEEDRERYEDWQLRQQEESQVGTPRKDRDADDALRQKVHEKDAGALVKPDPTHSSRSCKSGSGSTRSALAHPIRVAPTQKSSRQQEHLRIPSECWGLRWSRVPILGRACAPWQNVKVTSTDFPPFLFSFEEH